MVAKVERRAGRAPLEVSVDLMTPQFGGGATAREVDLQQWLRPSAVRGALRFWWRALNGHLYVETADLWEAERRIFGSAARRIDALVQGPGSVAVSVKRESAPLQPSDLLPWDEKPQDALNAAYFPAQGMGKTEPSKLIKPSAQILQSARIALSEVPTWTPMADSAWDEVRQALVAAVIFGGSGARTRRGAGALGFSNAATAKAIGAPTTHDDLIRYLRELPVGAVNVPAFSVADRDSVLVSQISHSTADSAQRELLLAWREVRQDRSHPPNWAGPSGWGRTRWPEADAIRIAASRHARWKDVSHAPDPTNRDRAPRAHLGLPIVVKFKDGPDPKHPLADRRTHSSRGVYLAEDPKPSDLVGRRNGKEVDRYASPVWLAICRVFNPTSYLGVVLISASRLDFEVTRSGNTDHFAAGPYADVVSRIKAKLAGQFITISPQHDS